MIKLSVLICCFLAALQNGYSEEINLNQRFLGGCPEVKSKSPYVPPSKLNGKWYTQWLYSDYSPLKYFPCQSIGFDFSAHHYPKITTQFGLPYKNVIIPEMEGAIQTSSSNEYFFSSNNGVLANIPQKTVILESHYSGATLVWTCLDFKFFHFESVQVMTKFKESPSGSYTNEQTLNNLRLSFRKYGISPQSFKKVDQSC